jgi:hypothetical protein
MKNSIDKEDDFFSELHEKLYGKFGRKFYKYFDEQFLDTICMRLYWELDDKMYKKLYMQLHWHGPI